MTQAEERFGEGSVVAGKYRLVERLGEGGMGTVWRADHLTLKSQVAVKVVRPRVMQSEEAVKRFLREAQAAASLRSPHVVQILDHGVDEGVPYMVLELLDGETLAQRLARQNRLGLAETARIVAHVARAVARAHAVGIVHRDLKPDNVFLVQNEDEEIAKVLDFGIAKMQPVLEELTDVSTQTGALLGTPGYMSPEQVRGHDVDTRADLWSMAVIAFECLTGRLPFKARTVGDLLVEICTGPIPRPSSIAPVPPAFDAWFERGACRDVGGRFQSAREMADALRAAVDPASASSSRTSMPDIVVRPAGGSDTKLMGGSAGHGPTERSPAPEPRPAGSGETMDQAVMATPWSAPTRSGARRTVAFAIVGVVLVAGIVSVGLLQDRAPAPPPATSSPHGVRSAATPAPAGFPAIEPIGDAPPSPAAVPTASASAAAPNKHPKKTPPRVPSAAKPESPQQPPASPPAATAAPKDKLGF